jgi:hypothetical protein
MTCAGCGAEVAPGSRWCNSCAAMWQSRDAAVTPAPTAPPVAPAPPAPPPQWAPPPAPMPSTPFPPANPYTTPFDSFIPPTAPPGRGRRKGMGAVAVVAVAVLVVAGLAVLGLHHTTSRSSATAGHTTLPAAPEVAVPVGYRAFVDHADHFHIAVPTGWRQIDLSSPGTHQRFQQLLQDDPKLATVVGSGASISKALRFLAADVNLYGFSPNVNIGVQTAVGVQDKDLPAALDGIRAQYDRAGIRILRTEYVPMAGHQALQLTVTNPALSHSAGVTVVQDFVAANDLMYVVTFTGSNQDFQSIAATFSVS